MQKTRKKIVDTSITIGKGGRADMAATRPSKSMNKQIKNCKNRIKIGENQLAPEEINAQDIVKEYNLKGFEFGNWLSNDERYDHLIAAQASLSYLRFLFKSDNIGFNNMIGVAFGGRGMGGRAAAHYEPMFNMINLTATKGAGCFAHEYGHALDYNFGRYIDQHKTYSALSGGSMSGHKPLIENVGSSLRAMVNEIIDYCFILDRGKQWEGYWAQRNEVFARMFEEYVAATLCENKTKNHYIARRVEFYYASGYYLNQQDFKPLISKFSKLVRAMGTILNSKTKVNMPPVPYPLPKAAAKPKGVTATQGTLFSRSIKSTKKRSK